MERSGFLGVLGLSGSIALVACSSYMFQKDDFPARLKKGCSSRRECVVLVQNARARLVECREYAAGDYSNANSGSQVSQRSTASAPSENETGLKYHDHWTGCHYEAMDYERAKELLVKWESSVRVAPTASGATLGVIAAPPEPSAR